MSESASGVRIVNRAQFHELVDYLLDLREASHPRSKLDPAEIVSECGKGKYKASLDAIFTANSLLRELVDWAINHQVGSMVPGPHRDDLDHHSHEFVGELYLKSPGAFAGDNPTFRRHVVQFLIAYHLLSVSSELARELYVSLEALNHGEITPLLKPQRRRGHGAVLTLSRLRTHAIEYVHFLCGMGSTRAAAREDVAAAFGVPVETLRSWERRKTNGPMREAMQKLKQNARRAGGMVRRLKISLNEIDSIEIAPGRTIGDLSPATDMWTLAFATEPMPENDPLDTLMRLARTDLGKLGQKYREAQRDNPVEPEHGA